MNLGKLELVSVREAWPGEASDFTPWLSAETNLSSLGEEIGLDLELVETESGVGPYRADILAKSVDTGGIVVIENQFGKTDHNHLGQLLTYAAGVGSDGSGAKTVIWIAEKFSEPHRAALDWLNKCTEPGIRFFGVELQLWRIGDSARAPKFSIISRPNDWQKKLTQETSSPSNTEQIYLDFWVCFIDYCEKQSTTLKFPNPWPRHWLPTTIGRSGFGVHFSASKQKQRFGCELYLTGPFAKLSFKKLAEMAPTISAKLGSDPEFQELPNKESSRIVEYTTGDVADKSQWTNIHKWLKTRGEAYVAVFTPLVKELKQDGLL